MKRTPRFIRVGVALGVCGALALCAASAAEKDSKSRPDPDDLKKYDKNANGKLDPDEDAARKADEAREERKKKG